MYPVCIIVKSNFFIRFLGELKIPKRHFEINWPLAKAAALLYNHIEGKIAWSLPPHNVSFCEFLSGFGIILCHGVFIILAFDIFAKTISDCFYDQEYTIKPNTNLEKLTVCTSLVVLSTTAMKRACFPSIMFRDSPLDWVILK